ncbi:ABC transporter permease DevC [Roseofilum casamattae]|uniref:ABC transporter permease DevC n=1 Tax=Roseofilum casamattae BLCC-M143 TaxID=3022442 RepID=A0ABT7BRT4_9CYAN|nr:ABC transporter permease DevC [Roseofilum casamattae]MDJ1181908.1 ABC transporter permease DevC [Roseofilum casamattae BLCC-M143]
MIPWKGPAVAWHNLVKVKSRLIIAIAAIGFSVSLIFLQLCFLGALLKGATSLYDNLQFDLVLVSPKTPELLSLSSFPRRRLYQAERIASVESIAPIYLTFRFWRNVENYRRRGILIIGINPDRAIFQDPNLNEQLVTIREQDTVLMSELSRDEYGPRSVGLETELGDRQTRITGLFTMSNSLRANGIVITSIPNFLRYAQNYSIEQINLGLIQLKTGTNPDAVVAELRDLLPKDVLVMNRSEAEIRDRQFWLRSTSLGLIVIVAVITAIVVGTVVVYQILDADVSEHLSEYATLKAMGYSNRDLSGIVLKEGAILAVLGYLPGLLVGIALYQAIYQATRLPIQLTSLEVIGVFLATLTMCSTSALVALRKIFLADPADIF